jgi:hypothetical protein
MRTSGETILTKMPADVQAEFNRTVRKVIAAFLVEGSGLTVARKSAA